MKNKKKKTVHRPRIEIIEVPLGYRLPPTPAPPIDLDNHTDKASPYWKRASQNAK